MEENNYWYGTIEPDCEYEFSIKRFFPQLFYITGLPLLFVGIGLWFGINGYGNALGDATFYRVSDKMLYLKRFDDLSMIYGSFVSTIWVLSRVEKDIISRI